MGRGQGKTNAAASTTEGFRRVLGTGRTTIPDTGKPRELTPEELEGVASAVYFTHEEHLNPPWATTRTWEDEDGLEHAVTLKITPEDDGEFTLWSEDFVLAADSFTYGLDCKVVMADGLVVVQDLNIRGLWVGKPKGGKPSDAATKTVSVWLAEFMRRWAQEHPRAVDGARRTGLRNRYQLALADREELLRKVKDANDDLRSLAEELLAPRPG